MPRDMSNIYICGIACIKHGEVQEEIEYTGAMQRENCKDFAVTTNGAWPIFARKTRHDEAYDIVWPFHYIWSMLESGGRDTLCPIAAKGFAAYCLLYLEELIKQESRESYLQYIDTIKSRYFNLSVYGISDSDYRITTTPPYYVAQHRSIDKTQQEIIKEAIEHHYTDEALFWEQSKDELNKQLLPAEANRLAALVIDYLEKLQEETAAPKEKATSNRGYTPAEATNSKLKILFKNNAKGKYTTFIELANSCQNSYNFARLVVAAEPYLLKGTTGEAIRTALCSLGYDVTPNASAWYRSIQTARDSKTPKINGEIERYRANLST